MERDGDEDITMSQEGGEGGWNGEGGKGVWD